MDISGAGVNARFGGVVAPTVKRSLSVLQQCIETSRDIRRAVGVDPVGVGRKDDIVQVDPREIVLEVDRSRGLDSLRLQRLGELSDER